MSAVLNGLRGVLIFNIFHVLAFFLCLVPDTHLFHFHSFSFSRIRWWWW